MTSPSGLPDPKANFFGSLLKAQARSEAEIRRLLIATAADAAKSAEKALSKSDGIGNQIRAAQYREAEAAIRHVLTGFWVKYRDSVRAGREAGISAAIRAGINWDLLLFKEATKSRAQLQALKSGMSTTAERNVSRMLRRYTHETIPLSEKVYRTKQLADGWVDKKVNSAIGRGLSARDFAKEVRNLIRPDVRGGVSYAAMRLARTEINNANHYAAMNDADGKPFVTGMGWRLSRSHEEIDECDKLAANSPYRLGHVPNKPHPNCFCYIFPETVDDDTFVEQFHSGAYDEYLSKKYGI